MNVESIVHRRLDEFLAGPNPQLAWLRVVAAEHEFLPLYIGWTATLGLRPDGTFVRWEQEADPPELEDLSSGSWQRFAIARGAN